MSYANTMGAQMLKDSVQFKESHALGIILPFSSGIAENLRTNSKICIGLNEDISNKKMIP